MTRSKNKRDYDKGLEKILQELKESLYDPEFAAEARQLAAELRKTRKPFNAEEYTAHLNKPEFKCLQYLHLVTGDTDD